LESFLCKLRGIHSLTNRLFLPSKFECTHIEIMFLNLQEHIWNLYFNRCYKKEKTECYGQMHWGSFQLLFQFIYFLSHCFSMGLLRSMNMLKCTQNSQRKAHSVYFTNLFDHKTLFFFNCSLTWWGTILLKINWRTLS
jgi:hypothetical protein